MIATQCDAISSGMGARQLDRGRGGGRAVLGELHHVRAVDDAAQLLGALHLERRGPGEVDAVLHRGDRSAQHGGVGVTECHRAQPHAVLDELIAVDIPDPTALAPDDEARRAGGKLVVSLGIGMTAARDKIVRLFLQLLGLSKIHRPIP